MSGQNSDIDTDHVDDNNDNDNNLDNFDFGKASVGINEDDENGFNANDNFDAYNFSGFEDLSLSGGTSDSSDADIDDYAHSEEEEVKQLVKRARLTKNVVSLLDLFRRVSFYGCCF